MDFAIVSRIDVFTGAPQQGSAAKFGTKGITFRARRARDVAEWSRALEAHACTVVPKHRPTA